MFYAVCGMHARCGAWPKRYPIPGYRTRPPCVPGPALTSELRRPVPDLAACRVGNLSLSQVDCALGFYPLCPYCEHNGDCPRFPTGLEMPQWGPPLCSLILRANNNTKAGLKPRFFSVRVCQVACKSVPTVAPVYSRNLSKPYPQ